MPKESLLNRLEISVDPEQVPVLMNQWLSAMPQLSMELHTVVFVALVHGELVFIHPYIDGNG